MVPKSTPKESKPVFFCNSETGVCIYTVEPAIMATLYSDHLLIAATFNRFLHDLPYYNLPVYSGHLYITANFGQSLGWPLLIGSTIYVLL